MTILCLASGKGGTGKTTNAAQLAERRVAAGRRVLMVDTDRQGNLALWASQRISAGKPAIPCISLFGENMSDQVMEFAPKYDDIVIDTRGTEAGNVEMYEALTVANIILSPIRTSLFDAATTLELSKTMRIIRRVNRNVKAFMMMNDVSTHPHSTRDQKIREQLADLPEFDGVLKTQISHRTVFERVAEMGMSAAEFGGDPKAVSEVNALAAEVWR